MAGDWPEVRLRDLSQVITKGTTPTSLGFRFTDAGINFVKSESVTFDGSIDRSKFARIAEETHAALRRSQLKEGDVLFSMAGVYIGKTAVVPKDILPANTNQAVGIVRLKQELAHPRFIDYFLRNPSYNLFLNNLVSQSAQPNLNLAEIGNLPISLPPLADQKAIASVLGALDDKIELNRCMNATLESMARALFQSWFVDFDPVRAKLDGRQPVGLDVATSALFATHLEETTLGHTPQGWEISSLDKIANYLNGLALQKYPPGDGPTLPVIKIAQLRKGDSLGADRCNTELPPAYVVEDGDVLFSWSGSLEVEIWCGGPGALNQHLFKVTSPEFPKWFYYLWTLYHLDDFRLIAAAKATTMGHIQRGHLNAAKVLVPPRPLIDAMTRIMSPFIEQIVANRQQSRTLATLRDTLLPKLLSGDLRVPGAEQIEGKVA